jgi:hypothetical protein
METIQTSVLAVAPRGRLVPAAPEASFFQLRSSSGFRIATQAPEIPIISATPEIPVTLIRKFPSGKELLFISAFWTVWQDFL